MLMGAASGKASIFGEGAGRGDKYGLPQTMGNRREPRAAKSCREGSRRLYAPDPQLFDIVAFVPGRFPPSVFRTFPLSRSFAPRHQHVIPRPSHLMRVRGLKRHQRPRKRLRPRSHLMRVRGLKRVLWRDVVLLIPVASHARQAVAGCGALCQGLICV